MKKIISVSFVLFFAISLVNANEMNFNINNETETNIETAIGNANMEPMLPMPGVGSFMEDAIALVLKITKKSEWNDFVTMFKWSNFGKMLIGKAKYEIGDFVVILSMREDGLKILREVPYLKGLSDGEIRDAARIFDANYFKVRKRKPDLLDVKEALLTTKAQVILHKAVKKNPYLSSVYLDENSRILSDEAFSFFNKQRELRVVSSQILDINTQLSTHLDKALHEYVKEMLQAFDKNIARTPYSGYSIDDIVCNLTQNSNDSYRELQRIFTETAGKLDNKIEKGFKEAAFNESGEAILFTERSMVFKAKKTGFREITIEISLG